MGIEDSQRTRRFAPTPGAVARARPGEAPIALLAFKDLLRLARLEQGLSFHQLAERSQVDVAYLHRLEDGQASRPGRNVAIRIAVGLGMDISATEELLLATGHLGLVRASPPLAGKAHSSSCDCQTEGARTPDREM